MAYVTRVDSFGNKRTDLLQRRELLFEVVQFLQKLPLLQQVVFRLVDGRVQQMHDVFHVLQTRRVLAGHTRCDEGDNGMTEEEIWNDGSHKKTTVFLPFSGDLTS